MIRLILILSTMISSAAGAATDDAAWDDFDTTVTTTASPNPRADFKIVIAPFGYEKRFETATNPTLDSHDPVNVAAGFRYRRHLVTLEYSQFADSSGNETYGTQRNFRDLLGWYRYAIFKNGVLRTNAGVAFGAYQESVSAHFYEARDNSSSSTQWTGAVGIGEEIEPIKYLTFMIEGRLITGQNLDPNPNPDFLMRMLIQF